MAIQTSEQMRDRIHEVVGSPLSSLNVRSFFELWIGDTRVFDTSVDVDLKTVNGQPMGKFTVSRVRKGTKWSKVGFLLEKHVLTVGRIGTFQLQIGIIHEMLRKINEG